MTLIVVESPTKAKTLAKFLPSNYTIEATMGHIRDLPKSKFGVDVEHNFEPQYAVPKDKKSRVEELKKIIKKDKDLILATDPDREGEAIAWHVLNLVGISPKEAKRIVFHEITQEAVKKALEAPRKVNMELVDAQQARRVLDRLVGYKLSPLLWFKVRRGLSAGRVQSVALRLIVEREREIEKFKAVEYWEIWVKLQSENGDFEAKLVEEKGKKLSVKEQKSAQGVVDKLKISQYEVSNVNKKDVRRSPLPPFTTSTLQQASHSRLGFTPKKTMKLAQDLYEEGLITYHRTDSVILSEYALDIGRKYVESRFGKEYLPAKANVYKTKSKLAQEAHEAIRPTNPNTTNIELSKDHARVYDLIWKRFLASQMKEAVYEQVSADIKSGEYLLRASGSTVKFDGYQKVYGFESSADKDGEEKERKVPELYKGEVLKYLDINPTQHFTDPPPRYSEASLIKTLEEKGIGRPSTYAPTISTISERQYIEKEGRALKPTPVGVAVNDFLMANFANVLDFDFTAKMEDDLDSIAHGKIQWVPVIRSFYEPFEKHLEQVAKESKRVKIEVGETDETCPEGHKLVVRYGRFGKFLACEKFPEHKFTKSFEEKVEAKCPTCGGDVVMKRTKRKRSFYGCSNYPNCNWMSWTNPAKTAESEDETNPSK